MQDLKQEINLTKLPDGGYIVAGITSSFGVTPTGNYNDVFLIKTDASGSITWNKAYGRDGDDWGYGVVQTYDGGYAVTGLASNDSMDVGSEVYLFKTDANGDTLFTKSFGGTTGGINYNQGFAIIQTNDSGLAIAGSSYSFGYGASDMYLIKADKNGNLAFNSTFGSPSNDYAYAISQTSDKGFVLSGYTNGFGVDSSSFYLVKTDLSGVTIINPCPTAGIKQGNGNNATYRLFSVYPNPNNGQVTLKTTNPINNSEVLIYNQLGQIVLKQPLTNELTNLSLDVNSGVYQVRILSGSELIYQTKIIKE